MSDDYVFEDESGGEYKFEEGEDEWVFEDESDDEDTSEGTPTSSPKPKTHSSSLSASSSGIKRSNTTKIAINSSGSSLITIPNTRDSPKGSQSASRLPIKAAKKSAEEAKKPSEMKELENQIAALRIIESNGQDTKLLSLRPKRASTAPQQHRPYCGAVSSDPRINVVSEIVTTEETYINDLELLINLYVEPLRDKNRSKKRKPILTPQQSLTLFSNVEAIVNLNRVLLKELLIQTKLPPAEQRIGSAFSLLAKCLLIYTDYCSNQKDADALYNKLKASNSEFNALLEENVQRPECRQQNLNSFLIKPVQRVCKYPLLLRELLKHTPETHVDYQELNAAADAMQTSCLKLNERKREVENMSHFLTIKARTGKNFIESGRRFIQDGTIAILTDKPVSKSGKKRKGRKGRYVLFSDLIVFILEGKVAAQIPLQNAQLVENPLEDTPLAFAIVSRAAKKLLFLPQNEVEKANIIKIIKERFMADAAHTQNVRGMQQRQMPNRVASAKRPGSKIKTDAFLIESIHNGESKTIELPVDCKRLQILKAQIVRVHGLSCPPGFIQVSFVTQEGTVMPIPENAEFLQYLPFARKIHFEIVPL